MTPNNLPQGRIEPRLLTSPLGDLTPTTSKGYALIEWADKHLDQKLLPHQKLFYIHALELTPKADLYRHRELLMEGGRQGALKTSTGIVYCLWRLLEDNVDLCIITSAQRDNARETFIRTVKYIEDNPIIKSRTTSIRRANGQEAIQFDNGARFKVIGQASNARGNSAGIAWMDELLTHEDDDMWAAIRPTITAQPRGQLLATSNAGTPRSVVLNNMRNAAVAGGDNAPFIASWSSPPNKELDDWEGLAQALPALGRLVPHSDILSAMKSTSPNRFRAEYRCETIDNFETLIDKSAWEGMGDNQGSLLGYRGKVSAAIDVANDGHTTLGLAILLPDGKERVGIAGRWATTQEARKALPELIRKIRPRHLALAPGPAVATISASLKQLKPEPKTITMGNLAESATGFVDRVNSRHILHPEDPLLTSQAIAAHKKAAGDSFRFNREDGNVEALSAVAIASWFARNNAIKRDLRVITAG